ncbi:MAG TPA: DNA helicase, partial [Micromonosporaceae bacterium]|nr:DNA helicase [Micromonosporaceae bacterium]
MSHPPTVEQQAVIDAYRTGADLTVEAGAGTGKTSTLRMLAASTPGRKGVYLAYNRSIANDAAQAFPRDVVCKTAHGFAFAAVGKQYAHRLNAPRLPARLAAQYLGITQPIHFVRDKAPLSPTQLARVALAAVKRFCTSADIQIEPWHITRIAGLDDDPVHKLVQASILPIAIRAWEDINQIHGRLRFEHDHYLKMWGLTRPALPAEYVLFDEAQDANPVIAAIVEDQTGQRIAVGDRCQAIYGWNGAIDAMDRFDGKRLFLSKSFRFGPAIASEANKWLAVLGAQLSLTGFDQIASTIGMLPEPDAILCRTNAGAFTRVVESLAAGRTTALVGGGDDIRRMAEAAL